jgi:hypothetical protein
MAYHPGVGVSSLATSAPTLLSKIYVSVLLDIFRQISIDYSEYFAYTDFRTDVCVYKGVHRMKDYKEKLIKLLDKLASSQIEYIYHLACRLFGQTAD